MPSPPARWKMPDGADIACREKLLVLEENHAELAQAMQDAFEDAILMGVDAAAFRHVLRALIDTLQSPLRSPQTTP